MVLFLLGHHGSYTTPWDSTPVLLGMLALTLSALGILVASQMRSQQAFHGVVEILIVPMVFFSGAFFPVDKVGLLLVALAARSFDRQAGS